MVSMGQRGSFESIAAVMVAFMRKPTWTQAALAREVEIKPEAVRKILRGLKAGGYPIESEVARPHVYWRIDKKWQHGGVLFKPELVPELLRQLARSPRSKGRDRLIEAAMEQLPAAGKLQPTVPIAAPPLNEDDEPYLSVVEDAAARSKPLFMKYVSMVPGQMSERHASVHLIELGRHTRFVATCHRNGDLRRFRVDRIVQAKVDPNEPFRPRSKEEIATFLAESLDGFKGDGATLRCSFLVRSPEANWVSNNLLDGMRPETLRDGVRITVDTSAVVRLARYVVGLGDAARPETPELARLVADLARGALEQASMALQPADLPAAPALDAAEPVRPRSDV
jgi:predicted DNA-binding transcriptional regulator YafY